MKYSTMRKSNANNFERKSSKLVRDNLQEALFENEEVKLAQVKTLEKNLLCELPEKV